jgi:hypothetical protein
VSEWLDIVRIIGEAQTALPSFQLKGLLPDAPDLA